MIQSEVKNDTKDKFLKGGADEKKVDNHRLELQLWEREREAKLETTHHPHWLSSSPLWRKWLSHKSPNTPLLSTLITSDWAHAHKSNNRTTTKHRTFFHSLIPTHSYNLERFTYLFFNTIVKIFTCLWVLVFFF